MEREIQHVWRTLSGNPADGYRVWEAMQVMGEPGTTRDPDSDPFFVKARDGSWWYVYCAHFWLMEQAERHIGEDEWLRALGQKIIIIPPREVGSRHS